MFLTLPNPCPGCEGSEGEKSLHARLSEDQRERLAQIRTAVEGRTKSARRSKSHIETLDCWLLDGEQKKALANRPEAVFDLWGVSETEKKRFQKCRMSRRNTVIPG